MKHDPFALYKALIRERFMERRLQSMEAAASSRPGLRPLVGHRPLPARPMFGKGRR